MTDIETAKTKGAMALFGEKYGDEVRVLTMGNGFSVELCGGTHVSRTATLVCSRSPPRAARLGVRRIEAVTGAAALAWVAETEERLRDAAQVVKGSRDTVLDKLTALVERSRSWRKKSNSSRPRPRVLPVSDLAAGCTAVGWSYGAGTAC
ncbi:hypothetical protein UMZ34_18140 [Halopseudomonas pachastrellae]|nr:hypothetical protein UMZ34_18140 [Halopseudomonas pachastrellae]